MSAKLLGAHMPTGKGLGYAVREGKRIGCTALQVFTSSPQTWKSAPMSDQKIEDFKKAKAETGIDVVVSHDSYLVNLCSPAEENREKSIAGLKCEIERCAAYGIGWVVSHIGACVGQEFDVAMKAAAVSAKRVLAETPDDVMLLAETTAGQGSSLNSTFEGLAQFFDLMGSPKRLGVCVDTCHIFAAGYDIRTPETYAATMARFDELVGISNIKAIHCNDSKMAFDSHRDRHAHIGQGEIGIEAFRCLVNDPRFENVPILLETPEAETEHEVNLRRLMELRR